MTKKSNWFVTRKPNESEYALYDFARTATQAKNMLRDLGEGNPIAHKSKSEGGLYNIYVKKGTVLWREKGGSTYQGGGEIPFDISGEVYVTFKDGSEETIDASGDRRFASSEEEAEERWMNTLLEDEDIEEVDGSVTATKVSTYQGGGEINVSWNKKAGKPNVVINGEEHGSISSAIEYYTLNSKKGNPNAEKNKVILIKLKKLKSGSTYAEGGEVKPENVDLGDGFELVFNDDHSVDVEYKGNGRSLIVSYSRFENDGFSYEDNAPDVPDSVYEDAEEHEEAIRAWEDSASYAEGGEIKSKEYYINAYDDRRERAVKEYAKENDGEELEDIDSYIGNDFNAEEIAGSRLVWHSDNPYESWIKDVESSHSEGRVWNTDKEVTRILSNFKTQQSKGGSTYQGGGEVEEVWNGWSVNQREHFLSDHKVLSNKADDKRVSLYRLDELPIDLLTVIKSKIKEHIERGSYKKGGSTYAEGGGIKGNYFEGELSFLNY
jgi:hypothetical protein